MFRVQDLHVSYDRADTVFLKNSDSASDKEDKI